ncbi:hypothetical protein KSP39_PZI013243 [Platanthera zijinensis]|uniref:Uncharacterized protein n=1 Tax=Platanthera zijinensis TaxID=2320716 RepID=A0AAP0BCB1_9ASPA
MATASLLPRHYPARFTGHSRSSIKPKFPASFHVRRKPNPRFSPSSTTSFTDSSSFSWDHEEKRWLREEQRRWLREEQRWLREEIRWSSERESLLLEISSLRLRVKALEGNRSPLAASVEAARIAEKRRPLLAEAETVPTEEDELNEKFLEGIRIPEEEKGKEMLKEVKERKTLRIGSEGEDVRQMQKALLELGFFSGKMIWSTPTSPVGRSALLKLGKLLWELWKMGL